MDNNCAHSTEVSIYKSLREEFVGLGTYKVAECHINKHTGHRHQEDQQAAYPAIPCYDGLALHNLYTGYDTEKLKKNKNGHGSILRQSE